MESNTAQHTGSWWMKYIVLFTILGLAGFLVAKAAEYSGLSAFTCNFTCGAILCLYVIENLSLLADLNQTKALALSEAIQKKALLQSESNHVGIIKELTETNKALVNINTNLKDTIEERNTQDRERGDEAVKCIIHWRNAWNSTDFNCQESQSSPHSSPCNSENDTSPHIASHRQAPKLNTRLRQVLKVPPITQEEPL